MDGSRSQTKVPKTKTTNREAEQEGARGGTERKETDTECETEEAMGGDGEFVPTREELLESRGNFGSGGKNMATHDAMVEARLPLGARDACSKLLIPLNKCRVDSFYLPWKCEDERHGYEKCEYEIFLQRMRKIQEARQSQQLPQPQLATQ